MTGLSHIKMKLFIRTDIWDRITANGFREATHAGSMAKSVILEWDSTSLFNLFMKRLLQSDTLCREFNINREIILSDLYLQKTFINRIFPDKIDTGKNPKTFDWICGRLQDGKNKTMPRELIQFCLMLRGEQLQRLEKAPTSLSGEQLFERASFKAALSPISKTRLEKTIYAESPACKPWLRALRGKKSLQSVETLGIIWNTDNNVTRDRVDSLVNIGVLRELPFPQGRLLEIPILYRAALDIVRGAEVGLRDEAQRSVESDANDADTDD